MEYIETYTQEKHLVQNAQNVATQIYFYGSIVYNSEKLRT